jgi:plastocyanin domain-containing protein
VEAKAMPLLKYSIIDEITKETVVSYNPNKAIEGWRVEWRELRQGEKKVARRDGQTL